MKAVSDMNEQEARDYVEVLKLLENIQTRSDIKSVEIIDQFEDDHLQCAETKINGIEWDFMWHDDLGFLTYWEDSDKAVADLITVLQDHVGAVIEDLEEDLKNGCFKS